MPSVSDNYLPVFDLAIFITASVYIGRALSLPFQSKAFLLFAFFSSGILCEVLIHHWQAVHVLTALAMAPLNIAARVFCSYWVARTPAKNFQGWAAAAFASCMMMLPALALACIPPHGGSDSVRDALVLCVFSFAVQVFATPWFINKNPEKFRSASWRASAGIWSAASIYLAVRAALTHSGIG